MNAKPGPPNERPLGGVAKVAAGGLSAACIAAFYVFAILSLAAMFLLIVVELGLVLLGARFGLALFVVKFFRRDLAVVAIYVRAFRLRKGSDSTIVLTPEEAPGLFSILECLCPRAGVALPHEVSLAMNVNAWVQLKGYRRGAGRTRLGIGYDLLAGLSAEEVETVLAHEMVHARRVQRGLKHLLTGGLARAAQLSRSLTAHVEACRRAKQFPGLSGVLVRASDGLTRAAAAAIARYSRQDEFEADLGAAELCGAGPVRAALTKIGPMTRITARLPWRERVARLQMGEFSQWLVKELAAARPSGAEEAARDFSSEYSPHPSVRDRLAALPEAAPAGAPGPSGISLLAEPDATAAKLVAKLEQLAAEQEQKDSAALEKWSRARPGQTSLRPLQSVGILFALAGGVAACAMLALHNLVGTGLAAFGLVPAGILIYRQGAYHERLALPIPDFALIKAAARKKIVAADGQIKPIEAECHALCGMEKGNADRAFKLASLSYRSLAECDYLRAHVAARLSLAAAPKSVEGALALAIASAAFGQRSQAASAIAAVQQRTSMRGASTAWGLGWSHFLGGDWVRAEAFLAQARKQHPEDATVSSLLAFCQSRRAKLQSAILSARRACAPEPRNKEHALLLFELLVEGGHLREAREKLPGLQRELSGDTDFLLATVRLYLLLGDRPKAEETTGILRASVSGQTLVRLGSIYEMARDSEKAGAFFQEALSVGHFPEALLGLGRAAAERGAKDQARRHALSALNLSRPLGENATGPLLVFQQVLHQLIALEDVAPDCEAWIASTGSAASPAAAANKSFLIYTPAGHAPNQWLHDIIQAMQPESASPASTQIHWRRAPKEQQPFGPVRPGVQGVFG